MKLPHFTLPDTQAFKQDKFFTWSIRLSILMQLIAFILLFISWSKLPPAIPLFYSLPWGEEQLAPTPGLFLLLFSGLVIMLANTIGAFFIFTKSQFFSHMLLVTTIIFTFLIGLTGIQILLMIT